MLDAISVLQQLINLLSFSQECDVNLTAAVSILSLVVMNFGNQTVERRISEVHIRRKDVSVDISLHALTYKHMYIIYTHSHNMHTSQHTHTSWCCQLAVV